DVGAEKSVAPRVQSVHVVVEEDGAVVDVAVPAVLDELDSGLLTRRVGVLQWRPQRQRVAADRRDLVDDLGVRQTLADLDADAWAQPGGAGNSDRRRASRGRRGQRGLPGDSLVGRYGLLEGQASDHAVGGL